MMAWLKGEPGRRVVTQILTSNPGECFAHAFNFTEVYYLIFRQGGAARAEAAMQALLKDGIAVREDLDTAFWREAATFKASHPMALPDAFCLALARRLGGTAVTTDHAEFDALIPLNYAPILFIR